MPQEKGPSKRGRPRKTTEASRKRINSLFTEKKVGTRRRQELMSLVADWFASGVHINDIRDQFEKRYPLYAKLVEGENLWDLLREAGEEGLFHHTPQGDRDLKRQLEKDHEWLEGNVEVVQTGSTDALAQSAAEKLLQMIRDVRHHKNTDEVHVGFAGGMTLRTVAKKLADLLQKSSSENPRTIVFHAMVASFFDDDFYADPNSFISYFVNRKCRVEFRLVRLPLPGIIETAKYGDIRSLLSIKDVFRRRDEIQIVVTSGSLWSDDKSTLRAYLRAYSDSPRESTSSNQAKQEMTLPDSLIDEFNENGVIGDLLWQPINEQGPVNIGAEYKVVTLMGLDELPGFIDQGGSVLLVMGCSGVSGMPKSELLETILDLHSTHRWVTHVVSDTPTVEGIYNPTLNSFPLPSGAKPKSKPK